jgi:nicotinamide mononucleotide adenylyltransferase
MCRIASEPAPWLTVDPWEASHEEYTRTALVLDHFDHEINVVRRGIATKNGERKQAKVALLAGADLIGTMSTPGVWSEPDLDHILGQYGAFIIERNGTDINDALSHLKRWEQNIWVIPQLIQNDVSSTKIRSFLDRKMSVNYLIPAAVIKYIEQYGLYEDGQLQSRPNSGSSTPTSDNNDAQKSNN